MNEKARIFLNCHQKGRRLIFEDLFDEQFGAFLNRFRHANGALALLTNSGLSLFVTPAPRHELALRRVSNFAVSSLVENPAYKDTPVGVEFGDPGIDIQLTAAIKAAKAGLPVLVLGETGTGKEVIANLLHEAITGNRGDLIAINCAAVPESLIESELFGHVEGAFTGSKRGGAPGKIELADGGTLFLDEIGDMPLALQARLLRVLETKSVSRLGSGSTRKVDFRLVCATHQDIASAVQEGRFRRDLYYRINGAIVKLPTLRERRNIKALTTRLLHELTQGARSLSDDALILISLHSWPGNIRELRHALTYAHAMAPDGEPLRPEDFRLAEGSAPLSQLGESNRSRPSSLATLEKNAVANAMLVSNGHVGRAAATLGISRSTLYRWLKKQG